MRILFCCEFYPPSVGGVQEVVRQIAERLAARSHEVTVATTALRARRGELLNGVRIQSFEIAGNRVWGLRGDVDAYRSLLLSGRHDAVVFYAAQQWAFDAAWPILERIEGRRIFVPCGFSSLLEPAYRDYFEELPRILRTFHGHVFHSASYRDIEFARAHGIQPLTVIPNGADEREFSAAPDPGFRARYGIPEDDLLLLTVGSVTGVKGHREILEAFERLDPGRPVTLLLNGGPQSEPGRPLFSRVKSAIRLAAGRPAGGAAVLKECREIASRINGRGDGKRAAIRALPRPEVVQAFLAADLFVFASQIEYSPLVLYEACAAGTAFLSGPAGNAEELAAWTGGGEICPAASDARGYTHVDPAVLAERIARLLADPARRRTLGEAGRRAWRERHTWERISHLYEQTLLGSERAAAL